MIEFASAGSGSKGNASLVRAGDTTVLVDCGFSIKEMEKRLSALAVDPAHLSAILVTHEHSDHLKGVLPLARKYQIPIKITAGTLRAIKQLSHQDHKLLDLVSGGRDFVLDELTVTPVSVPHDAAEPVQYTFSVNDIKLGILTDLGSITPHVLESFDHCQGLLLESNHDEVMLQQGVYPLALKRRVGGNWGHLSNVQASRLLSQLKTDKLQQLVLGHVSEQNNTASRLAEAMQPLSTSLPPFHVASQAGDNCWLPLSG